MMHTTKRKRAFTLIETLICTALLAILVWATVLISGVTNYAITDSMKQFDQLNGYDKFLAAYTSDIKSADRIEIVHDTQLYVHTSDGSRFYEFDHNRLYLDGEELFKAKAGKFYFNGRSVSLTMTPEGFDTVELNVYIDQTY